MLLLPEGTHSGSASFDLKFSLVDILAEQLMARPGIIIESLRPHELCWSVHGTQRAHSASDVGAGHVACWEPFEEHAGHVAYDSRTARATPSWEATAFGPLEDLDLQISLGFEISTHTT